MSIKACRRNQESILAKYNHFIEEKNRTPLKIQTTEDFQYHSPLKKTNLIKFTLILEIIKYAFQEFTN
jgi:hypothetical protein